MLLAAQQRQWQLSYMEPQDLYLQSGEAMGSMRPLQVFADPAHWYELGEARQQPLGELDVILMRKDPPFDNEFLYATHILEAAERAGALVVNRPASLRDCNEKLFATRFPQCSPPKVFADPAHWYELGEARQQPLGELDVILMRKDPPFDNEFLYATHILEAAERAGALVVNRPASLRDCNEKLFATRFPQCSPP